MTIFSQGSVSTHLRSSTITFLVVSKRLF